MSEKFDIFEIMMKICLVLFFSRLSSAATPVNIEFDTYEAEASDEDLDFMPYVDTTLDFRGKLRSRFGLEVVIEAKDYDSVCSPIAAALPIGKMIIGAKKGSGTEKELLSAMGFPKRGENRPAFTQIVRELQYCKGVRIDIASRLYVPHNLNVRMSFIRRASAIFGSANTISYMHIQKPEQAHKEINNWVRNKTRYISHLLPHTVILPNASIIVVTAVSFRANFKIPFHRSHRQNFYSPFRIYRAEMMEKTAQYYYHECEDLDAQVVEIPYIYEQAALVIILPNTRTGLPEMLEKFKKKPNVLNVAMKKMSLTLLTLVIPKFKIETTLDLKHYYEKVDIKSIFTPASSDLYRIIRKQKMFVSYAFQKTIIRVYETGTEPGAGYGSRPTNSPSRALEFIADHPFMFFVKVYHGQLYAGIVNSPKP